MRQTNYLALALLAPPAKRYQKSVRNAGNWWAPGHTFLAAAPATKLTCIDSIGGYIPNGAEAWAKPVAGMLTENFGRFRNYVDRGNPAVKESK